MKQKIIIINRWNDEFSNYHQYIDHKSHDVKYITNGNGSQIQNISNTDIVVVNNLDNREEVLSAAKSCVNSMHGITKIIAMSEFDLEVAAFLRTSFQLSGIEEEKVLLYRDKVVMKNAIAAAGINTPLYREVSNTQDVLEIVEQLGYPVIIKPRKGASSNGVFKLENAMHLNILDSINFDDYECEQFIDGHVYHIDGAIKNKKVLFSVVSKYINNCLEFNNGKPLGSVVIQDSKLLKHINEFTVDVLHALDLNIGIFHLEIIVNKKSNKIYFLEIGARCGGGEIPYILNEIHNINLMELWSKLELGDEFTFNVPDSLGKDITGFLMIPEPPISPCKVIKCDSLKKNIKNIYFELLPPQGYVFNGTFGYDDISGRFRYIGSSTEEVEHAILSTINQFSIITEQIR